MKFLKNSFVLGTIITLILLPASFAASKAEDPYEKIEKITQELISIISLHQKDYPKNEKQYFEAISDLLINTVDFNYIAKKVMGQYRANITKQQRLLFAEKFRQGLIETYGRGLINYGNQQIVLINRSPLKKGQKTLILQQEIVSSGNKFPLRYSMARKKTGEWMVINMTISGINLRDIFRNQFSQSVQQMSGDFDAVISGWATNVE
ncbi:MAG: ABC transporter substrate-binding protein [Porticoccaceae bacterium]|nr:ABC transporter substrate-binding protein [Porticoccaceae bacterium]